MVNFVSREDTRICPFFVFYAQLDNNVVNAITECQNDYTKDKLECMIKDIKLYQRHLTTVKTENYISTIIETNV